jgi:hypothetical protein
MVYEVKIRDNHVLKGVIHKKMVEKAINKVTSFFNGGKISFKIIFVKSRKDYDHFRGIKTQKWEVAWILNDETIVLFDKSVFHKVSNHPQKYFYSTLVHEITHIYTEQIFGFIYPVWLSEGVSYIVADQLTEIKRHIKKDLKKFHTGSQWLKEQAYASSALFVKFLIKVYGKEKLIRLMKGLRKFEKKKDFNETFKKVFNNNFNSVLNNWLKSKQTS